jgi:citrate lyase beta subunit
MSPRSCLFVPADRPDLAAHPGGMVTVDGRIVDAPVLLRARALLRRRQP